MIDDSIDPDEPIDLEHVGRAGHRALVMAGAVPPGSTSAPRWCVRLHMAAHFVVSAGGQTTTDLRVAEAIENTIRTPAGRDAVRLLVRSADASALVAFVRSTT